MSVHRHGDAWYVHGRTRVLGPFPSEKAALRALAREDEE